MMFGGEKAPAASASDPRSRTDQGGERSETDGNAESGQIARGALGQGIVEVPLLLRKRREKRVY